MRAKRKKQSGLSNSGLMAVKSADLFALLSRVTDDNAQKEFYLTDIVNIANADGRACVAVTTAPFDVAGINSRAQLAEMEGEWQTPSSGPGNGRRRDFDCARDGVVCSGYGARPRCPDRTQRLFRPRRQRWRTMLKSAPIAISKAPASPAEPKSAPSPDCVPAQCSRKRPRSAISSKPRRRICTKAQRPIT